MTATGSLVSFLISVPWWGGVGDGGVFMWGHGFGERVGSLGRMMTCPLYAGIRSPSPTRIAVIWPLWTMR
jgi:hypothetical protein